MLTILDFNIEGATPSDLVAFNRALVYLSRNPTANDIMQRLAADDSLTIQIVHNNGDGFLLLDGQKTIFWDPRSAMAVASNTDDHGTVGIQSAALGLLHEGAHATDPNYSTNFRTPDTQYKNLAEKYAVGKENIVASDFGEPQRFNHLINGFTQTDNPTEHTAVSPSGSRIWVQSDDAGVVTPQGTYELGTFPGTGPVGGGTGTGTLTVDGPDITINPDFHRGVIIKGDNDTVIEDNASITVSSGGSATIVGDGNSVALENTSGGSLELSGTGNKIASGSDTISVGPGTSSINYNAQQKVADVTTTADNGSVQQTVFDTGTEAWSSQTSAFDAYQRLQSQRVDFDNGGQQIKQFDPNNTHPYIEFGVSQNATGQITTAQVTLDPAVLMQEPAKVRGLNELGGSPGCDIVSFRWNRKVPAVAIRTARNEI